MNCYIFDIDGTIADNSHRQHFVQQEKKDWKAYNALMHLDTPHQHIIQLVRLLRNQFGTRVFICTGREDVYHDTTTMWLHQYGVPYDALLMRKEKDYRPDEVVKKEMLDFIRADGRTVTMAFDDRNKVVAMWRANGVPCAQVAEGDF